MSDQSDNGGGARKKPRPAASPAGKGPGKVARSAWDWAGPVPYSCSRCGSAWVTPDLRPRCGACGYQEGT